MLLIHLRQKTLSPRPPSSPVIILPQSSCQKIPPSTQSPQQFRDRPSLSPVPRFLFPYPQAVLPSFLILILLLLLLLFLLVIFMVLLLLFLPVPICRGFIDAPYRLKPRTCRLT